MHQQKKKKVNGHEIIILLFLTFSMFILYLYCIGKPFSLYIINDQEQK